MFSNYFFYYIFAIAAISSQSLQQQSRSNNQVPMPAFVKPNKSLSDGDNQSTKRPVLTVPLIVPYTGSRYPLGPLCGEQIRLALTNIYKKQGILDDYELNVEMIDDECNRPFHVQRFINSIERQDVTTKNRVPLVLGSMCAGSQYTGTMLKYYNYVGMSTMTAVAEIFTNRRRYDGFYLTTPSLPSHARAMAAVMVKNNFRKVAILSETLTYFLDTEKALFKAFTVNNITVVTQAKITLIPGIAIQPSDIERGVVDIAKSEARVMILYTNYASKLACFLHRYGLYGPGYALFMVRFGYFTKLDRERYPWCTETMLETVLKSIIFFGDAGDLDIYGKDLEEDSIGTSGGDFTKYLRETVNHPEREFTWWAPWRAACYDVTVGAAMWLNTVEETLKQQGDTLLNWRVSHRNFNQNGTAFRQIMKNNLPPRFRTVSGLIGIDPETGGNTYGNAPYIFYQVQRTKDEFDQDGSPVPDNTLPYLLYAFINGGQLIDTGKVNWYTHNGFPPLDSITKVTNLEPMVKPSAFIGLTVFASILILINGVLLIYYSISVPRNSAIRSTISLFNRATLVGNIILAGHILALPYETLGNVAQRCAVSYSFITVGYSIVVMSLIAKLELAKYLRLFVNFPNESDLALARTTALRGLLVMWVVFTAILMLVMFRTQPMEAVQRAMSESRSPYDISLFFIEMKTICDGAKITPEIPCIIAIGHLVAVLRAVFACAVLKGKQMARVPDLRRTILCFLFTLTGIFFAALVGGVILSDDASQMTLTISIVSLFVITFNTAMLFAPDLTSRNVRKSIAIGAGLPPASVAVGDGTNSRRSSAYSINTTNAQPSNHNSNGSGGNVNSQI